MNHKLKLVLALSIIGFLISCSSPQVPTVPAITALDCDVYQTQDKSKWYKPKVTKIKEEKIGHIRTFYSNTSEDSKYLLAKGFIKGENGELYSMEDFTIVLATDESYVNPTSNQVIADIHLYNKKGWFYIDSYKGKCTYRTYKVHMVNF